MHTIVQARTFPITQMETNYTTLKANQTWSASVGIECILMPIMSWHFIEQDAINLMQEEILNNQ
jgi:hypothetical protein